MKTKFSLFAPVFALACLIIQPLTNAETVQTGIGPVELQSGYPSEASVTKIYDTLDFQRACQAYVWALPAISMNEMQLANVRDWGVDFNTVGVVSGYTDPKIEALWFGPQPPADKESNWTKTLPGKGWFAYFRAYSPTEAFFDKTWKLSDIEKVK